MYLDGWLEDSWYAPSCDITDAKSQVDHEASSLRINPAYGVLLRATENEETEGTTSVYVNDPEQSSVVAEEYENLNLSPSSPAKPLASKKQSKNLNNSELSNDYEIHYF